MVASSCSHPAQIVNEARQQQDMLYCTQVCVRSSGPVRVSIGGSVLEQSVPSSFNAVLLCEDVQLDHGRVPISIQWASAPNSVQTLLQLWVVSLRALCTVRDEDSVARTHVVQGMAACHHGGHIFACMSYYTIALRFVSDLRCQSSTTLSAMSRALRLCVANKAQQFDPS